MFSKLAVAFTAATALSTMVVASPTPGGAGAGSCSTGSLQCCNQVQSANSLGVSTLLGLLGVVLQDLDILVGVSCSPINVVGVGSGNACSSNAVCCDNNNVGGLLSVGCLPVSL
ncbi:fungal hydrophobin [Trametes meyenii]|nr:fungal hydrophobin [Trametes meyenii]